MGKGAETVGELVYTQVEQSLQNISMHIDINIYVSVYTQTCTCIPLYPALSNNMGNILSFRFFCEGIYTKF